MKSSFELFCISLVFISILTGCNEDLEQENAELWANISEVQAELDSLNSVIATKEQVESENAQLKQEVSQIQAELDGLNSVIVTKEDAGLENTQLKQEISRIQAELDRLDAAIAAKDKMIDQIQFEIDKFGSIIPIEIILQKDESTMVLIPAGKFIMGTNDSQLDEITRTKPGLRVTFKHEQPQHTVHLDSYYIDKYETTNAQFERFVKETGHVTDAEKAGWGFVWEGTEVWPRIWGANWRSPLGPGSSILDKMDHPVIQVSYYDARAYAKWAGKRLPTEAEWEKAARGSIDDRLYPWGDLWSSRKLNSLEAGPRTTTPVGSYPDGVSPYGIHDMVGNVWEWVADWYYVDYYEKCVSFNALTNPRGPYNGTHKVLRGGCWQNTRTVTRCSHRDNYISVPDFRVQLGGFRCAKDADL